MLLCAAVVACLQDFVTLQFIPPGTDLKPILPVLAKVFDQVREQMVNQFVFVWLVKPACSRSCHDWASQGV
jgi:hypothetical protein